MASKSLHSKDDLNAKTMFPNLSLQNVPAWRIIPVSKWLVTPIYKPFRPFGKGPTTFAITMVITH